MRIGRAAFRVPQAGCVGGAVCDVPLRGIAAADGRGTGRYQAARDVSPEVPLRASYPRGSNRGHVGCTMHVLFSDPTSHVNNSTHRVSGITALTRRVRGSPSPPQAINRPTRDVRRRHEFAGLRRGAPNPRRLLPNARRSLQPRAHAGDAPRDREGQQRRRRRRGKRRRQQRR